MDLFGVNVGDGIVVVALLLVMLPRRGRRGRRRPHRDRRARARRRGSFHAWVGVDAGVTPLAV